MGTSYLVAGAKVRISGEEYIVRRRVNDRWQFENPTSGDFKSYRHEELLCMLADGRLKLISDGTVRQIVKSSSNFPDLSPDDENVAKGRRAYAEAVKDLPNSLSVFAPVIRNVWSRIKWPEAPPSFVTVYRWKTRYRTAGGDMRGLADRSYAKGRRGPRYPREVIRSCEQAIELRYMRRFGNSIQDTLEYAQYLVVQENKARIESDQLPLPTRRLLKRMIDKIPEFDKLVARKGYVFAANHFRSVKGHITAERPLERVEIDHTRFDVVVIDDDTGAIFGRPNVTACIDVYTRTVLGIDISFENSGYYTVQRCLRHCIMPKIDLKKRFPGVENDWPSYGVPDNLVADHGLEFLGTSLEKAGYALGINIMLAPRKTPQAKGIIERFLGTLNSAIAHQCPGTTFSNIGQKGDYNPEREARVPFSALEDAVFTWIADVYHQKEHPALGMSPMEKWKESERTEEIRMPDDAEDLDVLLGRAETRTLTHNGVFFRHLQYNSPELTKLRKLEDAKLSVEIRVNDDDLSSIWVLSPLLDEPVRAYAIDPTYAQGLSLRRHEVYLARRADKSRAKANTEDLLESMEEIRGKLQIVESQKPSVLGRNFAAFMGRSRRQYANSAAAELQPPPELANEEQLTIEAPKGTDYGSSGAQKNQPRTERPEKRFKPILRPGYQCE